MEKMKAQLDELKSKRDEYKGSHSCSAKEGLGPGCSKNFIYHFESMKMLRVNIG